MSEAEMRKGGCLCGAVTYQVRGRMRPVLNCHCRQCARWTGYSVMATAARSGNIAIKGEDNISWYLSSDWAERGFCAVCGSNLFWRMPESGEISIMAGTLTPPTGLRIAAHIFVDDNSDYCEIRDDVPSLRRDQLGDLGDLIGEY